MKDKQVALPLPTLLHDRDGPDEPQGLAELEAAHARARLFLWLAQLRREPVAERGAVQLTAEQRAQVRALGYVN